MGVPGGRTAKRVVLETLGWVLVVAGIAAGIALAPWYPELAEGLLVCVTETKSTNDIERYARTLERSLQQEAA